MTDAPSPITSLQNDQVKALVRLRTRRERDREQLMLIEEPLVIARALAADHPMTKLYYCPEMIAAADQQLLLSVQAQTDQAVEVNAPVMAKISYRDQSAGLLVVAPQQRAHLEQLPKKSDSPALYVVLEGVEKPGNLGAVLRVADGAGADAVIVCGQGTDVFNPNVLRASRGANFTMPTVQCSHEQLWAFLAERKICALATSPTAADNWDQADLSQAVAIFLGTEHDGLSDEMLGNAAFKVSIPMAGAGDSLNVATTAAILLFEAVRQRRTSV